MNEFDTRALQKLYELIHYHDEVDITRCFYGSVSIEFHEANLKYLERLHELKNLIAFALEKNNL